MKIIIGFIIMSLGFVIALEELDQNLAQIWDLIAFAMVCFGTLAVAVMTMPSLKLRHILRILKNGLGKNHGLREECIENSLYFLQNKTVKTHADRIDVRILEDGLELMQLGFSKDKIENILSDRINKYTEDFMVVGGWVRGLSKYPPAFGLAGTVLGLIHLMKGLGEGTDPKETGLRMAIALVATFYGIIVANIFVNPIGDRVITNVREDQNLAEISLNTILMMSDQKDFVEIVENLSSNIPSQYKKLNFNYGLLEAS